MNTKERFSTSPQLPNPTLFKVAYKTNRKVSGTKNQGRRGNEKELYENIKKDKERANEGREFGVLDKKMNEESMEKS